MRYGLLLLLVFLSFASHADVVVPNETVNNYVNIRLSPDSSSEVVGKLGKGESAALVSSETGWYEVALPGGATGFISADWTEISADEPGAVEPSVEEGAPETHEDTVVESDAIKEEDTAVVSEPADDPLPQAVTEPVVTVEPEPAPEPEPEPEPEPMVETTKQAADVIEPEPAAPPVTAPSAASEISLKGSKDFLVRFRDESVGRNSQIYDDGNNIGIGTVEPKQRLEVNGSIQIHEQNSSVAGLMITQSSGDTGYIMHNRASTLTIGAGSEDRITIDRKGNVGIAVSKPKHPLEMASGAHVTTGGVWTNSSSRAKKDNIRALSAEDASATLHGLQPVQYQYRNDASEVYLGFIAEDVPELVAMQDRKTLSTMDIVAVLTKVIQQQQRQIDALETSVQALEHDKQTP